MFEQQPQFWPRFSTDRFRFAPVFKGTSWLAVFKVHDLDAGLSDRERAGLLELGFMQGSQGRFIYPHFPNEELVASVNNLFRGTLQVLTPDQVVVLHDSHSLKQSLPVELVDAIAWLYANKLPLLGSEIRRSLGESDMEQAQEIFDSLEPDQFMNPDRIRGWVSVALTGEISPVSEPILGLAVAKVSGAYQGEPPEIIVEWMEALAQFRGEPATREVDTSDADALRKANPVPEIGELVKWGDAGNRESGRVASISVDYPGSAWVVPSTPRTVEGLLIPGKVRVPIVELDGYSETAEVASDLNAKPAPAVDGPATRGILTLDDVASEEIRGLEDRGLNNDRIKRLIRGVYKSGLIRGRTPFLGEEGLTVKDMVSHWHFVRRELDAELGGETPQVLDAAAYLRDEMMQEFNEAQPELPGKASEVFAVVPVETTRMVASEELETQAIQDKLTRETVYGIGLHPRFVRSLDRDALVDRIEALNDKRIFRALQDALKPLTLTPLGFASLVPTAGPLPTRLVQDHVWSSYDPAETSDADYEKLVSEQSNGRLFFSAESAGAYLVEALKSSTNGEIARNNERVIQSVAQLSGESHQVIESLPHPLFLLADEIRAAGVFDKASKAQILGALNIDLSKSLSAMGDLGNLAGLSLQVVNNALVRESLGEQGGQTTRAELAAGILRNKQHGPRAFSLAISALDPELPKPSVMTGDESRSPMLVADDIDPYSSRSMPLGYLVNVNMISPLRFSEGLGDSAVLTNEALGALQPNYFEVANFNELYTKRFARHAIVDQDLNRADDLPATDSAIPVSDIANQLGTIEKGLQSMLGSWRSDERAREMLLDGITHWLGTHKHFKAVPFQSRVAEDVLADLENYPDSEMVVLLSRKTARRIRWQTAKVTSHLLANSEYSRQEAAEMASLKFKNARSMYAKYHSEVFDPMSILKPEALKYLSDQQAKAEKEAAREGGEKSKSEPVKRGERQNRGLVAGLSMKDLRGKTDTVLNHLSASNELDREKLCRKTKLWEAPDWTGLRSGELEGGAMEPAVADFFAQIRKGLPASSPVNVKKINLLYAKTILKMRDAFDDTRTVDQLKEKISDSLGQVIRDLEDEASELGVSPDLILGKHRGFLRPSEYLDYVLRRSMSRTRQNEEWPNELIQKKAAFRGGSKDTAGAMPALTRLVRKGAPDYRNDQDIDEETLIRTFGFSGVEYGESMPQAERTTYLNYAYDGFRDLAAALEVNPQALSLGGTLGLAFGSRGRGGRRAALAHFEPSNNVINLTRMKGAGSMAHEFGHALANYFSRMVSGQARGPGDLAESVSAGDRFKALERESLGGLRKEIYDSFSVIMANTRYKFSDEQTALNLGEMGSGYKPDSDMRQGARFADSDRKKPYWATPAEMFARSFETWINEKLKSKDAGFQNDFLVRPDKLSVWGKTMNQQREDGDNPRKAQLYPSGDQLSVLSKAFQSLVTSMKEGTKRVDHEHLGEIDMPYLYSHDTGSIQRLQKEDMGPLSQCIIAELARMCGPEVEVKFHQELKDDHGNDVAGRFTSIEGGDYTPSKGLRGIVEIAHGAPMSVAWHEAFHYAQSFLLTEEEQQSLDIAFATGNELHGRLIQSLLADGKSELVECCDNPKEAQAYAYQQWVAGSLDLKIEEQPRTLFGEIKSFFGKVLGLTNAAGFNSPEQLFQSFYDGRLAARSNLQESITASASNQYQTLELDAQTLTEEPEWEYESTDSIAPSW
jgi:hypothetical protein